MLVGAHLSIAGGYDNALSRAVEIGANCLQIFSGNPRSFAGPSVFSNKEVDEFKKDAIAKGIFPVYFHAPYLVNLASEEKTGDASVRLLISELSAASRLGIRGSIIHLGSFKKAEGMEKDRQYKLLIKRVKTILDSVEGDSAFIIENAGTRKIGRTIEEIADIMEGVNNKRARVCLDICHLHSAGYDISTSDKLEAFLKKFDRIIGLEQLECIHANDSRDEFGSLRDRHENIGEGAIGREVFRILVNNKKTKDLPFIIETPGFDGNGPDKENIDILKSLAK